MNRLTWDQTWLEVALTIARRSRCVRSQAGCVLVTADNQVVAASYNGPPAGMQVEGDCSNWCPRATTGGSMSYDDCPAVHAEQNAIALADRSRLAGGTAYVTRTPCLTCSKVLANSGVTCVIYVADNPEDKDRHPELSVALLERSGIVCVGVRCTA